MKTASLKALGKIASIETNPRRKFVSSIKEALTQLKADNATEIARLNTREPLTRLRSLGFDGDGSLLLESASNLEPDDAWYKLLHDIEKQTATLERRVLMAEKFLTEGAL